MHLNRANTPLLEIAFPSDLRQFVERQAHELKFNTSEDYVFSILERALSESSHDNQGIYAQKQWIQHPQALVDSASGHH
jgi:hypothetical protein